MARTAYEDLVHAYRKKHNKPNIGIPQQTQRKMWKLIQGLMTSINDPTIGTTPRGDGGRSLYPLLQDIVKNEWLKGRPNGKENDQQVVLDSGFLKELSRVPFLWTKRSFDCPYIFHDDCTDRINLVKAMEESIGNFDKDLRWKFETDESGHLTTKMKNGLALPDGGELQLPPKRGLMVLSPMQAKLVANVGKGQPGWLSRNAPGIATGAASGLAAFLLGKRYAFDPLR